MKAFPSISKEPMDDGDGCFYTPSSEGMDLRDYFAAKALDFSLRDVGLVSVAEIEEIKEAVNLAYTIADSMMEARNATK
jgi:hypothetical protein